MNDRIQKKVTTAGWNQVEVLYSAVDLHTTFYFPCEIQVCMAP